MVEGRGFCRPRGRPRWLATRGPGVVRSQVVGQMARPSRAAAVEGEPFAVADGPAYRSPTGLVKDTSCPSPPQMPRPYTIDYTNGVRWTPPTSPGTSARAKSSGRRSWPYIDLDTALQHRFSRASA